MKKRLSGLAGLVGKSFLAGAGLFGAASSTSCDFVTYEDIRDTYVGDVGLPPSGNGLWAVKLYSVEAIESFNASAVLGPEDGNYATFVCSRENPAKIVVGFERPFVTCTASYKSEEETLSPRVCAASPLYLAGFSDAPPRFICNSRRNAELVAFPTEEGESSEIYFDPTQRGDERTVILEIIPGSMVPEDYEVEFNIGSFYIGHLIDD